MGKDTVGALAYVRNSLLLLSCEQLAWAKRSVRANKNQLSLSPPRRGNLGHAAS